MGFRIWMAAALLATAVAGCATGPETTEVRAGEKTEYLTMVERRLDAWEKEAAELSGERRTRMTASLNDARAEVRALEAAPEAQFDDYKKRIDSRLRHIEGIAEEAAE